MVRLMNKENDWDHNISCGLKEGPANCIRPWEVTKALERMKQHKRSVGGGYRNVTSCRCSWS